MNFLAADVIERFYTFLWPMLRISALMISAPIFSLTAFSLRLRILLALVLAWLVYPLHKWPMLDPSTAPGLVEVFNQIMIGSVMGLILQVVVGAIVVGGQSIAAAMGLSMANMLDPNMGNVPVISQLMIVMSTLIFVSFGGHAILLGLISESFHSLPIGTSILNQNVYGRVLQWSSMVFLGAVLMALPVMVSLLFINIGLGVVTRAAPSLNIFAVGFPAMIIAGFLILIISMESIGARIEWLWVQGFNVVRDVMGVPHV
ncbi:flagellar biosynthetic protein FliR [Limnohabitans sp. Rim47]|jgi:flagellar biosynthetic protein FliR|uniref:flagellar biosynthetic protein FliR n=1 Tax=Limnohabitans sp. Rim47 TaxID=1100721 RepID=UPI0002FCD14F|nr:flagellar biosynthetic protein FliR [Limnohabitans sp. Rim47]